MDRQRTVLSKTSKTTLSIIGVIIFFALFGFFSSPLRDPSPARSRFTNSKMGIIHIVMFEFKEEATEAEIADTCNRMLELKDQCLHPTSKTPYVKSGIGGKQNSPEGKTGGMTHIFVVEFANEEDRTYYLEKDPVHLGFVKSIGGVVKNAQVVDFTPGAF